MEITVEYSPRLMRRAARRFLVATMGKGAFVGLAGIGGLAVIARTADLGRTLTVGATLAFVVCALFFVFLFVAYDRRAVAVLQRLDPPLLTLGMEPEHFTVVNSIGESRCPWTACTGLRRFDEVWLLHLGPGQYLVLPTDQMNQPQREMLLGRLREHGVDVDL